jgi:hypothetical protein
MCSIAGGALEFRDARDRLSKSRSNARNYSRVFHGVSLEAMDHSAS